MIVQIDEPGIDTVFNEPVGNVFHTEDFRAMVAGSNNDHAGLGGIDWRGFPDFTGNEHVVAAFTGFFKFRSAAAGTDGNRVFLAAFKAKRLIAIREHLAQQLVRYRGYNMVRWFPLT